MASNALPPNIGNLLKLGNQMTGGLVALGQALGISQLTAADLRARLEAFVAAQIAFNTAREARQAVSSASTKFHTDIDAWLKKARSVLVPYLGRSWSAAWAPAGFANQSTAVPKRVGDQLNLLGLLSEYLTANPDYEDPAVGVTGVAGTALKTASTAADNALSAAETEATTKKDAREAALEALKSAMRMLTRILEELLAPDDPRWAAFGLNQPDADVTPGPPVNLTAHSDQTGAIVVQCDAVPLATRYRWRTRLAGSENDYTLAASTADPMAALTDFDAGVTVEILVQAVNGGQQGVASEPIEFTVPPDAAREEKPAAAAVAAAPVETLAAGAAATGGNGHANGHGNGHRRATHSRVK